MSHLGIAFHSKQGLIRFGLSDVFVIECYGSSSFLEELDETLHRPPRHPGPV